MKQYFLTKSDQNNLLGTFLDEKHYSIVLNEDCDVYVKSVLGEEHAGEDNCVLRFRKGWFTKEEQAGAYDGLKEAAVQSQNRGLAAGTRAQKLQGRDWVTASQIVILQRLSKLPDNENVKVTPEDIEQWKLIADSGRDAENRGLVWLSSERDQYGFIFANWLEGIYTKTNAQIKQDVQWIRDTFISDTTYANPVDSGIAGWFGRYPRIPYGRATSYTAHNRGKFELAYPFLQHLAEGFKELMPGRYATQVKAADKLDPRFYVPGTPFTTITVNKNFRTAAHRDAGDLNEGFSNLTVVARDRNYSGGYLVLPEVRAAVNIRPGDLLLVNNHEFIHGNTPILAPDVGELERISLVCYFREDMLELGSLEYETARYEFVECRRKNPQHALYRDGWNGVSAGMWDTDEWHQFLGSREGGGAMVAEYHPREQTLEDLFL